MYIYIYIYIYKYISIHTLQKSGSRFRNRSRLPRQCVTGFRQNSPTKPPPTPALECLRLREFLGLPESFCFLSGFRQRFWGSFSMALNGSPIWKVKTTPPSFSHLGVSGNGLGRFRSASNLRFRSRKWECCPLAQRAITLVDDEKPFVPVAYTSGPVEKALSSESMRFHKDLNLLPKPLTASDFSSSPADGSKVRVAYQGSPGAYSEAAAWKAYPKCETVPCDGFESTFKAVELWLVDKAVLPIENSFGGSVHRNYDLLLRHRLHIVGEVKLLVNHSLLGLPSVKLEEIKRVFSHPQALAQCEMMLTDLGTMRLNTDDTAGAAKMVASLGLKDTGAIASARAAEIYGLDILAQNIQDDDDNITRFLILAREPIIPGTDRPYKTSIVFTLVEGPGVLFKAFAVFALREIELTKIESRPQRQRPLRVVDDSNEGSAKYFDYLFYVDFEASMAEPRAQYALEHLQEFARFLRVLGSYPIDLKP